MNEAAHNNFSLLNFSNTQMKKKAKLLLSRDYQFFNGYFSRFVTQHATDEKFDFIFILYVCALGSVLFENRKCLHRMQTNLG